ncbi:MAG TPA: formate/nitrite transporter family protein [Methanospirillum sp.]|uniref:formate/nitrite transporter family protein n=1 Tax=Methanospirillum sp. TaxID=45200 RepID=UPI002BA37622|nr:formate/nitrite transporter family protein [Methanospirillum sp.]HWQ64321.1 formate/nitrite transporter family protein [Methanospirillum sp.]
MSYHPPISILPAGSDLGAYKAQLPAWNLLLRSAMSGAYIGMGAALMVAVTTGMELTLGAGLVRFIGGAVFPLGVILTVLTGAELFTGDAMLAPLAACRNQISWLMVVRLWVLAWAGNFIGAIFFAAIMSAGPLTFTDSSGFTSATVAGISTVSIATAKCSTMGLGGFFSLFVGSLAAGWLVNLGVLLALCADDVIGKIMGIWFPVMAMMASGLDHAVTNMYLIPAGLLTAGDLTPLQVAQVGPGIANLGWSTMWNNLIPASLGNLIGGLFFVGLLYWLSFKKELEG